MTPEPGNIGLTSVLIRHHIEFRTTSWGQGRSDVAPWILFYMIFSSVNWATPLNLIFFL